jgi:hypothetical protein
MVMIRVKRKLHNLLLLLCAYLTTSMPQALGVDVCNGYTTNWVDPHLESVFTSTVKPLKAVLSVNDPLFSSSPETCTGRLSIYLNSKRAFNEKIRGAKRFINGPWIVDTDKHEPIVVLYKCPLDRPGVTNEGETSFGYLYDAAKKRFTKMTPPKSWADSAQEAPAVKCRRTATSSNTSATVKWDSQNRNNSNWTLRISRQGKTLVSGPMPTVNLSKQDRPVWSTPRCYGPFVVSLDGSGEPQVDLRYELVLNKGKGSSTYYFERIFYYDEKTRRMKSVTRRWGENNPRFADLNHDGRLRFVTEDWGLMNAAFNEDGGPLQIWEWDKSHKLVDVTRQFPDEVKKHARFAREPYLDRQLPELDTPKLLGYFADLCLLGKQGEVRSLLRRGKTPTTRHAHKQMLAQLKKHGYI